MPYVSYVSKTFLICLELIQFSHKKVSVRALGATFNHLYVVIISVFFKSEKACIFVPQGSFEVSFDTYLAIWAKLDYFGFSSLCFWLLSTSK